VRVACSKVSSNQPQVLTSVKQLARCLALRQMVSEALLAAMEQQVPLMPRLAEAVGTTTASGMLYSPSRHIADVFGLPRPGYEKNGSPSTGDPFVTNMLVGRCSGAWPPCVMV
jgi:hypothetical protein